MADFYCGGGTLILVALECKHHFHILTSDESVRHKSRAECSAMQCMQAVDHPYLVVYSTSGANAAAAQRALAATAAGAEVPAAAEEDALAGGMCHVCHDPLEQPVVAACGHAFCRVCIGEYLDGCAEAGPAACPCCRRPLSVDLTAAAPVRSLSVAHQALEGLLSPAPVTAPACHSCKLNKAQRYTKSVSLWHITWA